VVASAALEVVYFRMLARAYRRAELSVVYPVARGLAPVLVLVGSVAVVGAATSAAQVAGVLLVGGGVLLVRGVRRGDRAGLLFGLAIAACIATYTVIDKHGVARATPLTYLELVMAGITAVYVPLVIAARGFESVRREIGCRTTFVGVAMFGGYAL